MFSQAAAIWKFRHFLLALVCLDFRKRYNRSWLGVGWAVIHPIAWTRCVGNGRSFYTAIGHRPESYVEPHSAILLERGIAWAMGLGGTGCPAVPRRANQ